MKSTEIKFTAIPSTEEVKAERDRLAYRSRYGRVLRSTMRWWWWPLWPCCWPPCFCRCCRCPATA